MLGWAGGLNISMVSIALLYVTLGALGYLRYGPLTAPTVTLNLPQAETPGLI